MLLAGKTLPDVERESGESYKSDLPPAKGDRWGSLESYRLPWSYKAVAVTVIRSGAGRGV